jgi:hypothetical protein
MPTRVSKPGSLCSLYEERICVIREKEIELITLSLMRDDVGSLHEERNEVNDS